MIRAGQILHQERQSALSGKMKLAEEEMPISNLRNELNIAKSVLELEGQKSEQLLRN